MSETGTGTIIPAAPGWCTAELLDGGRFRYCPIIAWDIWRDGSHYTAISINAAGRCEDAAFFRSPDGRIVSAIAGSGWANESLALQELVPKEERHA